MWKTGLWLVAALAIAVPASAQAPAAGSTKLSGKVHCDKADAAPVVEVGDKPGHALTIRKASCSWTDGQIAGLAPKSAMDVASTEISGATVKDGGYHTVTMDNGDKYTVHFAGTGTMNKDNSGTIDGKWSFVSGTGKLKGIKGSGTYKGNANADGTGDVNVEGDYTLPAAKPTPPAPAAKKK